MMCSKKTTGVNNRTLFEWQAHIVPVIKPGARVALRLIAEEEKEMRLLTWLLASVVWLAGAPATVAGAADQFANCEATS